MRDIWSLIARTSLAKMYVLLVGLVAMALTARLLGPAGRGELATVLTWVSTFATFGGLSIGQVALREAANDQVGAWKRSAFGALSFWCMVTSIGAVALAAGLYFISTGHLFGSIPVEYLLIGLLFIPFQIWIRYSNFLFPAMENLNILNRFLVLGSSVSLLILGLLSVLALLNVRGALIANLAAAAVSALGCYWFLFRTIGKPKLYEWKKNLAYLKGGLQLHLNAIGAFLFMSSDILMLNYYRGAEETAFYQMGAQFMLAMMVIAQSASMVIQGKVATHGANTAWHYQKKVMFFVTALLICIGILAGLTAPWWIVWFAGDEFLPTVGVFRWQLLAMVGMSFAVMMAPQWIGRGYFIQASAVTLVVGTGNVIANIYLIPEYGMYGAIWASLGVYVVAIISNGVMMILCERKSGMSGASCAG